MNLTFAQCRSALSTPGNDGLWRARTRIASDALCLVEMEEEEGDPSFSFLPALIAI